MSREIPPDSRHRPGLVIDARDLSRVYARGSNEVAGIRDVNLRLPEGEFALLKGDSGSGKSTLLSLLAGLDRPTSGSLTVAGRDLSSLAGMDLTRFRREVVGMVFQTFNLLPTLTVLENACLPALLAGESQGAARERALGLLDRLGLTPRADHLPSQLSGGEMQRTAIARALINNPRLILADEPTGNLDSANGQAVVELLAELGRARGRTVVMATHSDIADHLATRVLRLRDGRLAEE